MSTSSPFGTGTGTSVLYFITSGPPVCSITMADIVAGMVELEVEAEAAEADLEIEAEAEVDILPVASF